MIIQTRVLLPKRLWEEAQNKEQLKQLILQYMNKCYPDYAIKRVKNGFAICERRED
ncbi:hypothetical protein [Pseudobacillus wudalianchiensis]|uniref:hypothetical protein n=1 Tax=Pseudobacillus wudalianchiensis TaxID=1743143 RepID=UPI00159F04B2|nr:hypothetical protein [Bacillus wudalianchiensis]